MKKIINFFYQNQTVLITSVSYIIATCLFVKASLLYSASINTRVTHLKQELKVKESELTSFGSNIFKTSYMSRLNTLTCNERINVKFDIINAMYSAIANISGEVGNKMLTFEDELFKGRNDCTKEFYDRAALEKISAKVIFELKKDIKDDKKKLKDLQLSLFYTNEI